MLLADVTLNPSTSDLPGASVLQQLANGLGAWALIGSLIALVLGAVMWAIGSHTQNMHQSSAGRRAVVTSLAAAILVGAAPSLINFFFSDRTQGALMHSLLCFVNPVGCATHLAGEGDARRPLRCPDQLGPVERRVAVARHGVGAQLRGRARRASFAPRRRSS